MLIEWWSVIVRTEEDRWFVCMIGSGIWTEGRSSYLKEKEELEKKKQSEKKDDVVDWLRQIHIY